jgi:hypothetical protein
VEANGEEDSVVVGAELEEVVLEEVEVWIFYETVLFILKLQVKFSFPVVVILTILEDEEEEEVG